MENEHEIYRIDRTHFLNLIRLVRYLKKNWRNKTDAEILELAEYHYGGTKAEALIDALINS